MRLFIAMNGKSGFAIKPDGDVISVFAYDKHGRAILEASTAVGGKKLDAFDTVLPVIYAAHGFKATSRLKFSEQEKPEGWNYDTFKRFNNGRPDVVFMVNDPASMTRYQPTDGQLVEDYGEAVAIQDRAVSDVSFAREDERDAGYMDAVDRGDMRTAQRMVDEKAKNAGYTIPVYHFTDESFTAFDIQKGRAGAGIWLIRHGAKAN
jgi:hypothetical protein